MSFRVNPSCRIVAGSLAVLLIAAGAKIVAATGSEGFLENYDPILLLKNRWLNIAVAVVEIACAVVLTIRVSDAIKGYTLLWLGLNFVAYRLVSFLSEMETPCSCLGNIGSWLGLTQDQTETVAIALVFYILCAGVYLLFNDKRNRSFNSESNENYPVGSNVVL
jgi:hypothetical protein